ncbi:unnamed protein product, partial [Chrysoparadoxa australica]
MVRGGDARGTMTGSDMSGQVFGGRATALDIGATSGLDGATFDKVEDSAFVAHGGNATMELDGTNLTGAVTGGSAGALNVSLAAVGQTRFVQAGNITVTGGDAAGTSTEGSEVTVTGGSATGFILGGGQMAQGADPTSRVTYRTEGLMEVTGGDAAVSGPGTATGGAAVGMFSFNTAGDMPPKIEHAGVMRVTGGAGSTRRGAATGIEYSDFGFTGFDPEGQSVVNNSEILVSGEIYTDGEGIVDQTDPSGLFGASDGVRVAVTGSSKLTIDGGLIDVKGVNSNGLSVRAGTSETIVRNGAQVQVTADGGAGISIGASVRAFEVPNFVASVNTVIIDETSSVMSESGIGIQDDGRVRLAELNPETEEVETRDVDLGNQTTVDIAGTLSSGTGVAMDLGGGTDTLILRETANITGVSRLGDGDDRFIYQGFAETNAVDGGDGKDSVEVTVAGGDA